MNGPIDAELLGHGGTQHKSADRWLNKSVLSAHLLGELARFNHCRHSPDNIR